MILPDAINWYPVFLNDQYAVGKNVGNMLN